VTTAFQAHCHRSVETNRLALLRGIPQPSTIDVWIASAVGYLVGGSTGDAERAANLSRVARDGVAGGLMVYLSVPGALSTSHLT